MKMITVAVSETLKHPVHEESFKYNTPQNVSYRWIKEISLYSLRRKRFDFGPRMLYLPQIQDCDLIHSYNRCVLNKKSWVVDFEHAQSFSFKPEFMKPVSWFVLKKFFQSSYCKRLLPWSEFAKQSFLKNINDQKITEKITVLNPAIRVDQREKIKKESEKMKVIFVGNDFKRKGGNILLSIMKKIKDVDLTIVSTLRDCTPDERNVIRNSVQTAPYINLVEGMERERLLKDIYNQNDVFILPTLSESFGYSILEAMSKRLAIISTDIGAIPEMVVDEKNGFLIHSPQELIDYNAQYPYGHLKNFTLSKVQVQEMEHDLIKKIEEIRDNKKLLMTMKKRSLRIVEDKFTFKKRNRLLKGMYEESIK